MNLINSNTNLSKYKHISFKERVKIETYLAQGMSISRIARLLNRSRTTIYKEIKYGTTTQIKQNKKKIMYLADTSQAVYERNRKNSKKPFKILQSYDFIKYVQEKFYNNHWSLDSIYKRAKLDNLFNKMYVQKHYTTIWIYVF